MGFYFRKSIRVGPFRYNLSKSGIGVSVGVPGLRVGVGPRGAYVHVGAGGVYYRKTLSAPPKTLGPQTPAPKFNLASATEETVAATSGELLTDIQKTHGNWPLAPAIFVGCLFAFGVLLVVGKSTAWVALLVLLSSAALAVASTLDLRRKNTVLLYDLGCAQEAAYDELCGACREAATSGGKWQVHGSGIPSQRHQRSTIFTSTPRTAFSLRAGQPSGVTTNVETCGLRLRDKVIHFLPDKALLYLGNEVRAVEYDKIRFATGSSLWEETGVVPSDAVIHSQRWLNARIDGGPDRRFKTNYLIPTCDYEDVWISGLQAEPVHLLFSRKGIGSQLHQAVKKMALQLTAAKLNVPREVPTDIVIPPQLDATSPQRTTPTGTPPPLPPRAAAATPTADQLHECLFRVLCCLMTADGRASDMERTRIVQLMKRAGAQWDDALIAARFKQFSADLRTQGAGPVVKAMLAGVKLFVAAGKQQLILPYVDAFIRADGVVTESEQRMRRAILAAFGPQREPAGR